MGDTSSDFPNKVNPVEQEEDTTEYSKVRQDIIEDCLFELGYPVVSVFITKPQINRLIDFAVRKCSSKACPRFLQNFYVVSGGVIDVSDYDMETVSNIYGAAERVSTGTSSGSSDSLVVDINGNGTGSNCSSFLTGCNICEKLCNYRAYSYGMTDNTGRSGLFDALSWMYMKSEINNLTISDYYLDAQDRKLYIDNYSGYVAVEYTKSSITIEDLDKDSFWKNWVRDYTLALVKITEGRIRGKYKVTSSVFEIEADELINEGNSDKDELEQQLNEDIGYWNIMR